MSELRRLRREVAALREEVQRLREELAARPVTLPTIPMPYPVPVPLWPPVPAPAPWWEQWTTSDMGTAGSSVTVYS